MRERVARILQRSHRREVLLLHPRALRYGQLQRVQEVLRLLVAPAIGQGDHPIFGHRYEVQHHR